MPLNRTTVVVPRLIKIPKTPISSNQRGLCTCILETRPTLAPDVRRPGHLQPLAGKSVFNSLEWVKAYLVCRSVVSFPAVKLDSRASLTGPTIRYLSAVLCGAAPSGP